MLPPLYHPHELNESTRSQKPPTKLTSPALKASTSATSSSGHAYISDSNYMISVDTSISSRAHLRRVHLSSNSSSHQELSHRFRRKNN
ncbi:hypothetical protein PanWU01x14_365900 [Parasponia andersonii]|uniref:Uncharacterized protein n=1 Tax=Parasponia andersonii TaxID=3476 RepID=A0A2P5A5T0_PARAD|nr:hypothetical protein PanWU01x14_365900 [Parasponia andersonii]